MLPAVLNVLNGKLGAPYFDLQTEREKILLR